MKSATKPTDVGTNRTGMKASPIDAQTMLDGAAADLGILPDGQSLEAVRLAYSLSAPPLGTMPPPATVRGVAKAALNMARGKDANVFLDLLGERMAFERTGTRLYEALLVKWDAADSHDGGPDREDLEQIRDDELRHFALCQEAIEQLGADATAVTPSANVVGVAGLGWVQVLADPRTTLTEGLKVILQAELVDNDCWLSLTDLAARLGHDELAERFRDALADEEGHLARVRSWVVEATEVQAGLQARNDGSGAAVPAPL